MNDTHELLLSHSRAITEAAGHAYRSALPFTPHGTRLYKSFKADVERDIEIVLGCDKSWPSPAQSTSLPRGGHTAEVCSISFSVDGTHIVSGSLDTTVITWNVASGAIVKRFSGHKGKVSSAAFSASGRQIVSGSHDKTIVVWNTVSEELVRRLSEHTREVTSVSFSPDGTQIVSGSLDATAIIWDVATGAVVRRLAGDPGGLSSVAFSVDGTQIASGTYKEVVVIWDAVSGSITRKLEGHTDWVTTVSFLPDGLQLASTSSNETITWDATTGERLDSLVDKGNVAPSSFPFQVDVGSRALRAWDGAGKSRLVCTIPVSFPFGDLASWTLRSYGSYVAWGCVDGRMAIIRVKQVGGVALV